MMMTTDIFLSKQTSGIIYGLFASDEPLQIRYVGQTKYDAAFRLRQHFHSTSETYKNLRSWFDEVKARGAEIGMRVLGEYPKEFLTMSEYKWIDFWSRFCPLLNRKHYCFSTSGARSAAVKL